jgi:hypothetical protein
MRTDPMLNIASRQDEDLSLLMDSPQCHMYMRVFRIVMYGRNPLEIGTKIGFHFSHQPACERLKIQSITEFGRNNKFEEAWVTSLLPAPEQARNVIHFCDSTEHHALLRFGVRRALAREVTSMGGPLSHRSI